MEFSRKEYGMSSHSLLQGNLSNPGIEPWFPELKADSVPSEPPGGQCQCVEIFQQMQGTKVSHFHFTPLNL